MESYSNFTLSPATGLYRPTNHVDKMDFVSQTLTTDSNLQCDSMFLELHDFANIINGLHDTCFLKVLDFGGLQNVHCARKEVTKVEFTLRDINNHRINCCIFGNLADILTKAVKQPNYGDICLIRYAKINNYKGELQVSNAFDTSLVLINPDIKEAKSLKQMFHGDANAVDLYQHKNDKILIQKQRKKWYKLDLLVQDQTGESKFTLLETTATKIVKLSLAEIEDQEVLPPEIVEIYGKTYGFGISDDENNMIGGADKFNAMKVWNLNDIMWKRIKSLHQMSTYSRKKQCINDEGNKNKSG
ncbi:hypothetical protein F2Q70_00029644 [Brassica cretica]|uniref:DUF223 domain-containing protein n=1 Tax=Brassica cretica TaxID=69181 RepID=A0A8S9FJY7_BRACR|nr:hypothetical protein F2Q70_00029644 [Brassica cretica]